MPQGVHVWDVIERLHVNERWLRQDVLDITIDRWDDLKRGHSLFQFVEAEKLIAAFGEVYGVPPHQVFSFGADVLPPGRVRRARQYKSKKVAA